MTPRSEIRKELTDRFVPVLLSARFEGPREIAGNALLHEYRRKASSGTHVLRIQLEKRGLPRFIVQLYIEPLEGIDVVIAKGGTVVGAFVKPKRGIRRAELVSVRSDPMGATHAQETDC